MVKSVDTQDLKSCGHCGRAGSSPARGTLKPDSFESGFFCLDFKHLDIKKALMAQGFYSFTEMLLVNSHQISDASLNYVL